MNISTSAKEQLVRQLARLERPWTPYRDADQRSAVYAAREESKTLGVAIGEGPGSVAGRKAQAKAIDELVRARLFVRPAGRNSATLTETGRRVARGLAFGYLREEVDLAIDRWADCVAAGHYLDFGTGVRWVPETLIAGVGWDGSEESGLELTELQRMLLPLLADGVMVSNSTYAGHAFYGAVCPPDAIRAAAAVLVPDWASAPLVACGETTWHEVYNQQSAIVRSRIENDKEYRPEIGNILLRAGPLVSGIDYRNPVDVEPLCNAVLASAT